MMSLLELPELVVECILEKLPPEELCRMGSVCRCLRDWCRSDHLWEKHMRSKWGGIVGSYSLHIALRELIQAADAAASTSKHSDRGYLLNIRLSRKKRLRCAWAHPLPDSIIKSCYVALETATFCFPAQVYNRQNGHVGFLLSCYDATLTYNRRTNTFDARYPRDGVRASVVESGVRWERVRRSPVETCRPHDLHVSSSSDCLHHLKPDDHLEIQWRRNKDFPYGWWYVWWATWKHVMGLPPTADVNITRVWWWSSSNTHAAPVGEEVSSIGKTIGKKEMRRMAFTAE